MKTSAIPVDDATLLKWLLNATNPTTRWAGERIKQLKAEPEAINRDMLAALKFIHEHIADKARSARDLYPAFGLHAQRAIKMTAAAIARAEAHEGQRTETR